jgi:hypothetical protein
LEHPGEKNGQNAAGKTGGKQPWFPIKKGTQKTKLPETKSGKTPWKKFFKKVFSISTPPLTFASCYTR